MLLLRMVVHTVYLGQFLSLSTLRASAPLSTPSWAREIRCPLALTGWFKSPVYWMGVIDVWIWTRHTASCVTVGRDHDTQTCRPNSAISSYHNQSQAIQLVGLHQFQASDNYLHIWMLPSNGRKSQPPTPIWQLSTLVGVAQTFTIPPFLQHIHHTNLALVCPTKHQCGCTTMAATCRTLSRYCCAWNLSLLLLERSHNADRQSLDCPYPCSG